MKSINVLLCIILLSCGQNQPEKILADENEVNSSYQTNYFTTSDGVKLRYLTAGTGPVLFFQPGWMCPAEMFEPQLKELSTHFKVMVLDPRGQGLSEDSPDDNYVGRRAKDINELLKMEEIDSLTLAGWSLGVLDVLTFVEMFGANNLTNLVLIDGPISTEDVPVSPDGGTLHDHWKEFLHLLQTDRQGFEEFFVSAIFRDQHDSLFMNTIKERISNAPTNSSFVAMATHIMDARDYSEVLETVEIPILITLSPSWNWQEGFKNMEANVTIENFESHAHFVDDSERFNQLMIDLIKDR